MNNLAIKTTTINTIFFSSFFFVFAASAFQYIEGREVRNSYCKTLSKSASPHISEICFNYDYKFKLSALMGEPTEYSTIRWYWPNDMAQAIKFRASVLRENNITANEILNHAEFKKWLGYLTIDGQLFIKFPELGAASRLVLQTEPGFIQGANKEWSFNIPGSPSWDKLLLRTERHDCNNLDEAYTNAGSSKGKDYVDMLTPYHFLTKAQVQSFVKSYNKGEITHSFCNVRVYGHHDLKHVIYKIIEQKNCPTGDCPDEREEQVAKKKKPKVKDWFAKKKTNESNKSKDKLAGINSKQDILKKSTKGGVTDWFKVDKLTKQANQEKEKILPQERIAKEKDNEELAKQNKQTIEFLENKFNGYVLYTTPDSSLHIVRYGSSSALTSIIVDSKGNKVRRLRYNNVYVRKDGVYLASKYLGYNRGGKPGCDDIFKGTSNYEVLSLVDLKYQRSGTEKYRYVRTNICFSNG